MPPEPIQVAEKDCAKCKSRRIQCDRSLPGCRKCRSRDFPCPGYGIVLRWGQGVASRGRLTGRAAPVESAPPITVSIPQESFSVSLSLDDNGTETAFPYRNLLHRLLCHFDQSVAAKLAWVDGPENPWRNIILPLSHASPTVLYSVLAMASEDITNKCGPDHPLFHTFRYASLHYRQQTLSSLSGQLEALWTSPNSADRASQARCLLASILLLYNLDLLAAEDSRWRLHIQGARAILQQVTDILSSSDRTDIFLRYECYYSSVFIGLTTFDPADEIPSHVPTDDNITIFSDIIGIIHRVTRAERLRFTGGVDRDLTIDVVMRQLEEAKDRTVCLSRTLQFKYQDAGFDFDHLTHMYYHASAIYSQRVLADCSSATTMIHASRDAIFEHLGLLTRSAYFAHDLVWPLFIAGTECRGFPEKQQVIDRAMQDVIKVSGYLDRRRVLWFLRMFWGLEGDGDINWMHLARQQPTETSSFLIL